MATVMSLTILGTSRGCGPERTWHGAHEKRPPPTMRGWRPGWRGSARSTPVVLADGPGTQPDCWFLLSPQSLSPRRPSATAQGPDAAPLTTTIGIEDDRGAHGRRGESFTPRGRPAEGPGRRRASRLSISSRKRRRNSRTAWRPRPRRRPRPGRRPWTKWQRQARSRRSSRWSSSAPAPSTVKAPKGTGTAAAAEAEPVVFISSDPAPKTPTTAAAVNGER